MTMLISSIAAAIAAALPVVGYAHSDFRAWLSERVDDRMYYPGSAARAGESGIVTVRFELDEGRRPARVAILRSSGSAELDRAALETVATMSPAPAGAPHGPHAVVLEYNAKGEAMKEVARQEAMGSARACLAQSGAGDECRRS